MNKEMLMKEGFDVLNACGCYAPTKYGMETIWNAYVEAKTPVLKMLSAHPNYVPGKGFIVFSKEYDRPIDFNTFEEVMYNFIDMADMLLEDFVIPPFTYEEVAKNCDKTRRALYTAREITENGYNIPIGISIDELKAEFDKWSRKETDYAEHDVVFEGHKCFTGNSCRKVKKIKRLFRRLKAFGTRDESVTELLVTEKIVEQVNESELGIRGIREGQKLNKAIGKICRELGLDKHENYNKQFARLGDAISPKSFKRHTIISANWIDFWTKSYGDTWCSCENIDKMHKRFSSRNGFYGDGCHSSGTESYMLDPSTVVMYTVSEDYEGNDFELQNKINRCLFHVGIEEEKFVMGRIYPQGTDGAENIYKEWREQFQEVLATCLQIPNYWKTEKDKYEKLDQVETSGTHYPDYEYSYCDVAGWSWHKPNTNAKPKQGRILIGHNPICPCCGDEHDNEESIECKWCYEGGECYECGRRGTKDQMHEINDHWFCEECVFYCEYHEEWEWREDNEYYVEHYGNVCEDALYHSGDFFECDECGFHYVNGNEIFVDGRNFCCEDCAAGYGYTCVDGEWVREEE